MKLLINEDTFSGINHILSLRLNRSCAGLSPIVQCYECYCCLYTKKKSGKLKRNFSISEFWFFPFFFLNVHFVELEFWHWHHFYNFFLGSLLQSGRSACDFLRITTVNLFSRFSYRTDLACFYHILELSNILWIPVSEHDIEIIRFIILCSHTRYTHNFTLPRFKSVDFAVGKILQAIL